MSVASWKRAQSHGWCWRTIAGGHWSFWAEALQETWELAGYPEIPLATAWDLLEFL